MGSLFRDGDLLQRPGIVCYTRDLEVAGVTYNTPANELKELVREIGGGNSGETRMFW